MVYISCPQCAQSFNAERDLASLRAQLAAVTTERDQLRDALDAQRAAYYRSVKENETK